MHAILVTIGTDGDVIPYVGLGACLRSRGHQVTLVTSAKYEPVAARHGLRFRALVSSEEMHELLGHPDFWHPYKTATICAKWGVRFLERQYHLLAGLASNGDSLFVANPAVFAATLVHEKMGSPLAHIILQPWMIPSVIEPPVMPMVTFGPRTPRAVVKLAWRAIDVLGDHLIGPHLNPLRRSLGLEAKQRILGTWFSKQMILGMFPEWFAKPQSDWPAQTHLTGFPMYDGETSPQLPREVETFCHTGTLPIAFTFGTGMMHAQNLFQAAVEACEIAGVRGILLTKYRAQVPARLPANVMHCEFAAFQQLFPLCAAVVHHGGIGTTAKALATGTPQLILPICFDQMDNASRVARLGAGTSIKSRNCTGKQIAAAISNLVEAQTKTRTRSLKHRFEGADSFARAAELIEALHSSS